MKKAKEGRLRTLHRRDWPGFLNRVVPAPVWRAFRGQVDGPSGPQARWTPKYLVLCWVAIGWSIQNQLLERFREGWKLLARLYPRRRRPGGSYQGLTQATERFGVGILHRFWCCLRETIPRRLGRLWLWHGWVVLAVDGSRVEAPRTARNEEALGRAGRQKTSPQWWVTCVIHLPTSLLWDWRWGPGTSSERAHLREMLPSLPPRTLLVGDTGFGGFAFLGDLCRAGVHFLVRCASNTTLLVDGTRQKIERVGGATYVYLWPVDCHSQPPLRLRLIVLKRRGRRVYLLTNVMEPQRLSRRTAGAIYRARWDVEVEYRGLKQTLGRRKIVAKTPEPGAMELAGNILALALLLLQGALALGARATELSVATALRVIRRLIERVRYGRSTLRFLQDLRAAIKDQYIRHTSKRARDWPHKKREPPPKPPKLRRLNSREKARILACWRPPATAAG